MTISTVHPLIIYPESDGKPMADNTRQFRLITKIQGGLDALFKDQPNVFVAGDLFWYPVEKEPNIKQAPDVMVVFGRPKGDRRSYKQWFEENIAPQVVFEIASKSNTKVELEETKLEFYQDYGVEEYYLFYPEKGIVKGWLRRGSILEEIPSMSGWVSPRMSVRFEIEDKELQLYSRDGERFETFVEIIEGRKLQKQRAELERQRAELEQRRAEQAEGERDAEAAARQQAEGERDTQAAARQQAEGERDVAVAALRQTITSLLAKGWTQEQIAELLGLSVEFVENIAN